MTNKVKTLLPFSSGVKNASVTFVLFLRIKPTLFKAIRSLQSASPTTKNQPSSFDFGNSGENALETGRYNAIW